MSAVFIFFQALITIFIAGGFFFKQSGLKNQSLALFLLLFAADLLYFFLNAATNIGVDFPFQYGRTYYTVGMCYGPLLWIHFRSVLDADYCLTKWDLLHLVPVLLVNFHMLDIITMPYEERRAFFSSAQNFYTRVMNLNYVRASHQVVYGGLLFWLFWKWKAQIKVNVKFYLAGFSLIYLITTLVISLLTLFANSWLDFSWYYVLCTSFLFMILYVLIKEPKVFKAFKAKYGGTQLKKSTMQDILNRVEHAFTIDKAFLDNKLTLDVLSTKIDAKDYQISQSFSRLKNENFNDYTNRYRVDYAKQLLRDPAYANLKIEAIAIESGFNNRVTFYKAFSKFAKTTPSKFRKQA